MYAFPHNHIVQHRHIIVNEISKLIIIICWMISFIRTPTSHCNSAVRLTTQHLTLPSSHRPSPKYSYLITSSMEFLLKRIAILMFRAYDALFYGFGQRCNAYRTYSRQIFTMSFNTESLWSCRSLTCLLVWPRMRCSSGVSWKVARIFFILKFYIFLFSFFPWKWKVNTFFGYTQQTYVHNLHSFRDPFILTIFFTQLTIRP